MIWHFPQLISLISPSCANISYVVDIYYRTKTRISEFIHRACMILNRDYSPVTGLTDKRFRSPDVHDSLWLQSKPQPPGQYRLPSQHSTQTLNTGSRFAGDLREERSVWSLCVLLVASSVLRSRKITRDSTVKIAPKRSRKKLKCFAVKNQHNSARTVPKQSKCVILQLEPTRSIGWQICECFYLILPGIKDVCINKLLKNKCLEYLCGNSTPGWSLFANMASSLGKLRRVINIWHIFYLFCHYIDSIIAH